MLISMMYVFWNKCSSSQLIESSLFSTRVYGNEVITDHFMFTYVHLFHLLTSLSFFYMYVVVIQLVLNLFKLLFFEGIINRTTSEPIKSLVFIYGLNIEFYINRQLTFELECSKTTLNVQKSPSCWKYIGELSTLAY